MTLTTEEELCDDGSRLYSTVTERSGSHSAVPNESRSESGVSDGSRSHSAVPDGGYGWVIVFAAFMLQGISVGLAFCVGIYYTEWLDVFQAGQSTTAWVGSINTGLLFIGGPAASILSSRFSHRTVCAAGSILAASGLFLSAFVTSIHMLYITYSLVTGLGFSFMFIPTGVIVGEYFDKKRPIAMPLCVSGVGIFGLFLPSVIHALMNAYGWRGSLFITAGIALQGVIFASLLRPVPKFPNTLSQQKSSRRSYSLIVLKDVIFWLLFINNVLWNMGSLILIVFIVDYAKESGIDKDKGALLLASVGICGTCGRIFTALTGKCVNRLYMYTGATLVSGLSIGFVPAYASFPMYITCCCVYGVCFGLQVGILGVLTTDLFGVERLNAAFGYLIVSNGAGAMLGPPIAGVLYAFGRSYAVAFYFGGTVSILAGLLMIPIPILQRKSHHVTIDRSIEHDI